jgi:hypothetical protein
LQFTELQLSAVTFLRRGQSATLIAGFFGGQGGEKIMSKQGVATVLGRAFVDREFASLLQASPQRAAQSVGASLSKDELQGLQNLSLTQVKEASELLAAQQGLLQSSASTGSKLQDLVALLDQQQQQGGAQRLQDLAALLDQQQQQGGAQALRDLLSRLG